MGSSSRSFSLNQSYNMKAFIVLFALIAAAYAEAEAEADPYLLYGGYAGYAGWGGWTGYAGLPYGAYGYAAYPHGATAVVKSVETEPAKVEVKALTAPAVVAAPAAYTYHHAAPVAYAGYADIHMPIISLASVKLKLMLIQLTSTTDIPDTLDTDLDMDMLDTHMLVSMELMLDTHMLLILMPLMLMLHLTQPTPILSTPPV